MQTKTAVKYHFTSTRIITIKNMENDNYWQGYGEIPTLLMGM